MSKKIKKVEEKVYSIRQYFYLNKIVNREDSLIGLEREFKENKKISSEWLKILEKKNINF